MELKDDQWKIIEPMCPREKPRKNDKIQRSKGNKIMAIVNISTVLVAECNEGASPPDIQLVDTLKSKHNA